MDTDLRDTKARLIKLALAAAIGAILTWFTMAAVNSSGPAPNRDPVGAVEVPMLAIAIFAVTSTFAHRILSRRR